MKKSKVKKVRWVRERFNGPCWYTEGLEPINITIERSEDRKTFTYGSYHLGRWGEAPSLARAKRLSLERLLDVLDNFKSKVTSLSQV